MFYNIKGLNIVKNMVLLWVLIHFVEFVVVEKNIPLMGFQQIREYHVVQNVKKMEWYSLKNENVKNLIVKVLLNVLILMVVKAAIAQAIRKMEWLMLKVKYVVKKTVINPPHMVSQINEWRIALRTKKMVWLIWNILNVKKLIVIL